MCNDAIKIQETKTFRINDPDWNVETFGFETNVITTSKYTMKSFLPLFLLHNLNPMTKFANFYFLVVCVLQSIEIISITDSIPTSAVPLAFVLMIEAINDAREDIARHKADEEANNAKVEIFNKANEAFEELRWCDVRVGDIIKCYEKDIFPADLLFLRAADSRKPRSCFVNTKSMDGETDNKYRRALECTAGR